MGCRLNIFLLILTCEELSLHFQSWYSHLLINFAPLANADKKLFAKIRKVQIYYWINTKYIVKKEMVMFWFIVLPSVQNVSRYWMFQTRSWFVNSLDQF